MTVVTSKLSKHTAYKPRQFIVIHAAPIGFCITVSGSEKFHMKPGEYVGNLTLSENCEFAYCRLYFIQIT